MRSAIWSFRSLIRRTAELAADTLPLIWLARMNCSLRSSAVALPFGLVRIVKGCVFVWPPAVSRTWYCPGGAAGPRTPPAHMISPLKSFASGYRVSHTNRFSPCFTGGGGGGGRKLSSGTGGGGRAGRRGAAGEGFVSPSLRARKK